MARRALSRTRLDRRRAHCGPDDRGAARTPCARSRARGLPLVAAGDVHMHVRSRRAPAGRAHRDPPRRAGARVRPRALSERRAAPAPAGAARAIYPPELLAETVRVAERCRSRSTSCATSIPRSSCRRARRRRAGCASSPRTGLALALSRRRARQRPRAGRARARADRRARLRALLPHRARHRAVRARAQRSSARGAARRRTRRSATPRHHRGRSGAHVDAVRALHLARAQRAARHRRRFRAPAARGGDPVHLREVRPRPRGDRRHRRSPTARRARSATSARRSGSIRRRSTASRNRSPGGITGAIDPEQLRRGRLRPGEPGDPAAAASSSKRWSASRGTSRSTSAASSSRAGRSTRWCRSRTRRCRSAA